MSVDFKRIKKKRKTGMASFSEGTISVQNNEALGRLRPNPVKLGLLYDPGFNTVFAENAVELEVFVDFACPFSKKIFDMLTGVVLPFYKNQAGAGGCKLKINFMQTPQPWHPQSGLMHEAVLASWLLGGKQCYQRAYEVLMEKRDRFTDVETFDKTRRQIYADLAKLLASSGVPLEEKEIIRILSLDLSNGQKNSGTQACQALKWYVKYHRLHGMHVTPTCTINGTEANTSSGWTLEQWQGLLDPILSLL
jgi:hypothetical protein